jgi:hypothetical protein
MPSLFVVAIKAPDAMVTGAVTGIIAGMVTGYTMFVFFQAPF